MAGRKGCLDGGTKVKVCLGSQIFEHKGGPSAVTGERVEVVHISKWAGKMPNKNSRSEVPFVRSEKSHSSASG